jgi:hypothetical protein
MNALTKQKYFYYIAFMLIASTYLRVAFNNFPSILRSHHIWTIIWVVSLLIFYPQIFLNKILLYTLGYGCLLFLATVTIWSEMDNANQKRLFWEFYEIGIGVSVFTYFQITRDYIRLAKITKWAIIFFGVTAIMTLIASSVDPSYARNITSATSVLDESERASILSFMHYGGGTYGTAAAFMSLFPIFVYYYKNIKFSPIPKFQIIILSIIIFIALLRIQIFGNILISILFGIITLFGMKKVKQSVLVMVLFILIMFILPKSIYVNTLRSVSNYFEKDSDIQYKFRDMALFIDSGANIKDNTTGVSARVKRYPMLLKTFVKGPLLGCFYFSDGSAEGYNGLGYHLYWMNKLTVTGLIVLIIFLNIPYMFIKENLKNFTSNYKFYYILGSLSILSYGIIKAIIGRETWYAFFIILPGLYYLPLLIKKPLNKV